MTLNFESTPEFSKHMRSEATNNFLNRVCIRKRPKPPKDEEGISLLGKTAIVTGGNRGIGKEVATGLYVRGCRVIIACRSVVLGNEAVADILIKYPNSKGSLVVMNLDLASFTSTRNFAKEFLEKEDRLDFLVNNAGLVLDKIKLVDPMEVDGREGLETMAVVMYYSTVLLTTLLYDRMKIGTRIAFLQASSHLSVRAVDLDKLKCWPSEPPGMAAYSHVKLALNCFTACLAKKAFKDGIRVYAVDPGVSATDFSRELGSVQRALFFGPHSKLYLRTVKESGESVLCSILSDDIECYDPKDFYFTDGVPVTPAEAVRKEEGLKALWHHTCNIVKINNFDLMSQGQDDVRPFSA